MSRSCSDREDLVDTNLAEPHTALDSGELGRLPIPRFSDKTLTGASAAIWSTVPYLLKWAVAILKRLEREEKTGNEFRVADPDNPLRELKTILAPRISIPGDDSCEDAYACGWARHTIPSTHLGWLSTNGPQVERIMGKGSQPLALLYHGGQITGYLNSLYLFPATQSAVVVLTNAQGAGDCPDLVARALIQYLFKLKPPLDFCKIAEDIAKKQYGAYDRMKTEFEVHRERNTEAPRRDEIIGVYRNNDIRVTVQVFEDDQGLAMELNGKSSQRHRLSHYHHETFGFLPSSREEQELRCLVDYFIYEQFLLSFKRAETGGKFIGLTWKMQDDFSPLSFEKVSLQDHQQG